MTEVNRVAAILRQIAVAAANPNLHNSRSLRMQTSFPGWYQVASKKTTQPTRNQPGKTEPTPSQSKPAIINRTARKNSAAVASVSDNSVSDNSDKGRAGKSGVKKAKNQLATKQIAAKSKVTTVTDDFYFPIVGTGASAGGLEALKQFFDAVSSNTSTLNEHTA